MNAKGTLFMQNNAILTRLSNSINTFTGRFFDLKFGRAGRKHRRFRDVRMGHVFKTVHSSSQLIPIFVTP